MTAVPVCTAPPNTPEWLAARRGGIGGSDIATLLGHNPWATPLDLWAAKVRGDSTPAGAAAEWGHRLQPVVLAKYRDEHPDVIVETPEDDGVPSILAHPEHPIVRASLDALGHHRDDGPLPIEVKTAGSRQAGAWADGGMPDAYVVQVLWQLTVTGCSYAHVAALIGGQSYQERVIWRDDDWSAAAVEFACTWWDRHVVAGVMPDPDPIRDAPKLPRLWTPQPGMAVDLDPDLVARLRDARARAAAARAEADELAARVQIAMADATVGMVDDEPAVRWSPVKPRATVDVAAMKADGVYDNYVRWGEPSRRFTVNPREGERE